MKKKIVTVLLALTITGSLLAGCSGSGSSSDSASASAEGSTSSETASASSTESSADAITNVSEKYADKPDAFVDNLKASDYVDLSSIDYNNITVEVSTPDEVTDESVDETINQALQADQSLEEVTDRTDVQDGDYVNIDYTGTVDGEEFDGGSATDYDLQIGSGTFIDGFEDQLIGANVGDTVTVNVTFPDDYSEEDLQGKDAEFTVTINKIEQMVTPELTDDWVAGQSLTDDDGNEITTVDALKAYLKQAMTEQNEEQYQSDLENAIAEYLVQNTTFTEDPPQDLIDRMTEYYEQAWKVRAQSYGTDLDTLMSMYGYDEDAYTQLFSDWGEDRAKLMLILQAIADQEGLVPSDEDVQAFEESEISEYGYTSIDEFSEGMNASEEDLKEEQVRQIVMSFLEEKVTVEEPSTEASTSSTASTASESSDQAATATTTSESAEGTTE